jgi:prepilin peptidase CpaA
MTPPHVIIMAILLSVVVVAAVVDIRSRRIPNWLTVAGVILGFAANTCLYGFPGLYLAAQGMGLALLVYVPLFLVRGMGAGDVKLMAAVGCLAGPLPWFYIFIVTSLLGGVLAVALALSRGRLRRTLANLLFIVQQVLLFRAPHLGREALDVRNPEALRLPHGAVIAVGTVAYISILRIRGIL